MATTPSGRAKSKTQANPTQLDRIEQALGLVESRLTTLTAFETLMKVMEYPQPPKPVEKWVPKVGEAVVCDKSHQGEGGGIAWCGKAMDNLIGVPMRVQAVNLSGWAYCGRSSFDITWLRPATSEDVVKHEAKSKPVEKWAPKVGDMVVCDKNQSVDGGGIGWAGAMDKLVGVPMLVKAVYNSGWAFCNDWNFNNAWLRPVTPEEITGYKAKAKAEADAKELAKPIVFGTRVRLKGGGGGVWKIGCDEPTGQGNWRVCPPTISFSTRIVARHEFTVLD